MGHGWNEKDHVVLLKRRDWVKKTAFGKRRHSGFGIRHSQEDGIRHSAFARRRHSEKDGIRHSAFGIRKKTALGRRRHSGGVNSRLDIEQACLSALFEDVRR